jgi:hypothetical protein
MFNPAEMHLLGRLINLPSPLAAVFEALPDEPIESTAQPEALPASGRLGTAKFSERSSRCWRRSMSRCRPQISIRPSVACSAIVSPKDSIYSCLSTGTRGKEQRFERVALGCYRPAPSSSF